MDTLGSRMVGLMKQYGYTQKELAAEVRVATRLGKMTDMYREEIRE